jgi:hypothetical protein
MTEVRDTEGPAPGPQAGRPRLGWRLLRGTGWLVFYLVVAAVSYILLVLAGH